MKDSAEKVRRDFDFSKWLDSAETISTLSLSAIVVEGGFGVGPPPVTLPTDTTPLTINTSNSINADTGIRILWQAGTPGLTYKSTFIVTGSSSSRVKQVDVFVTVRPTL